MSQAATTPVDEGQGGEAAGRQDQVEAYRELAARVGRKAGKIPTALLVTHVMRHLPPTEQPARVEAVDALLRRYDSARRDGLKIEDRPDSGRRLGRYTTRSKKGGARPYESVLAGVDPIDGRCDCPDFLKSSLGLCKHLFVVLESIATRPNLLRAATTEQGRLAAEPHAGLEWDPYRPLTGPGDWLDRVSWVGDHADARWFGREEDGRRPLKKAHADDPEKRQALVEALQSLLPPADSPAARGPRADPALRALLARERERLRRVLDARLSPAEVRAAFKGLKRTLYPYQREGVARFLEEGRLLLADDMGLGKTAQAIASVDVLRRTGRARRALIIAPASLKSQWAREWAAFSDLPARVVDGLAPERRAVYESTDEGVLIINYEQLIRDLDVVRRWRPDVVVLDEAQRIKNWATKTALSVKGLTPTYRLVLTGTPMENRIEELASVVEWVDDMALEPKWRLGPVHAVRADGGKALVGVRGLDTLRERLRPCMVRRVRQDVLDQLPPRTDTRVPVEMTEPQVEQHDALTPSIAALAAVARKRPLMQKEFLRLMSLLTTQRIISNGLGQLQFDEIWPAVRNCTPEESVIHGLSAPKLLELRQLVRQLAVEQGRKIVIFSQWRRMLTLAHWAVSDLLAASSIRAAFFTGAEPQSRRTQNIVEFHEDPSLRLLFASDAGGVGLNLQHAANCVINLELPWNPAVLEQRIGRVYRLGQTSPIDVYNLVSEYGIESRIAGLVGSKQALFKGLFDGDTDAVKFDEAGSFLARVEKLYDPAVLESAAALKPDEDAQALEDQAADARLDDDASDPFEPLLEAADESADPPASPSAPPAPISTSPAPAEVRRLFSQLQIRREPTGRVVIEAPPEAADALAALFEGMAAMLHAAGRAEPASSEPTGPA